jgi:hypothetical protein
MSFNEVMAASGLSPSMEMRSAGLSTAAIPAIARRDEFPHQDSARRALPLSPQVSRRGRFP